METNFNDWLLGRVDGLKPGFVTVPNVNDVKTRPPYRLYTKYSVVIERAVEAPADWHLIMTDCWLMHGEMIVLWWFVHDFTIPVVYFVQFIL